MATVETWRVRHYLLAFFACLSVFLTAATPGVHDRSDGDRLSDVHVELARPRGRSAHHDDPREADRGRRPSQGHSGEHRRRARELSRQRARGRRELLRHRFHDAARPGRIGRRTSRQHDVGHARLQRDELHHESGGNRGAGRPTAHGHPRARVRAASRRSPHRRRPPQHAGSRSRERRGRQHQQTLRPKKKGAPATPRRPRAAGERDRSRFSPSAARPTPISATATARALARGVRPRGTARGRRRRRTPSNAVCTANKATRKSRRGSIRRRRLAQTASVAAHDRLRLQRQGRVRPHVQTAGRRQIPTRRVRRRILEPAESGAPRRYASSRASGSSSPAGTVTRISLRATSTSRDERGDQRQHRARRADDEQILIGIMQHVGHDGRARCRASSTRRQPIKSSSKYSPSPSGASSRAIVTCAPTNASAAVASSMPSMRINGRSL